MPARFLRGLPAKPRLENLAEVQNFLDFIAAQLSIVSFRQVQATQ
jgi:hypothetical protein